MVRAGGVSEYVVWKFFPTDAMSCIYTYQVTLSPFSWMEKADFYVLFLTFVEKMRSTFHTDQMWTLNDLGYNIKNLFHKIYVYFKSKANLDCGLYFTMTLKSAQLWRPRKFLTVSSTVATSQQLRNIPALLFDSTNFLAFLTIYNQRKGCVWMCTVLRYQKLTYQFFVTESLECWVLQKVHNYTEVLEKCLQQSTLRSISIWIFGMKGRN